MRIEKIREYLFEVLDNLLKSKQYKINVNFLDKGNYSVDRLPIEPIIQKWVNGTTLKREVYEFRSMKAYSQDTMTNLGNIGFFEEFEEVIETNNKNGILPAINGIEGIECLNVGSLASASPNEAIFTIQIQIEYIDTQKEHLSI